MTTTYAIVDFSLKAETKPGESVVIVGDHKALGAWDESQGLVLETTKETYPLWKSPKPLLIEVPASREQEVQYKIAVMKKDEDAEFEEISGNRKIVVTTKGAGMHCIVEATFGEGETEPLKIPKFSPPSRTADSPAEPAKPMGKTPSNSSMTKVASSASFGNLQKTTSNASISRVESGCGLDYQMQAKCENTGKEISFWHDIPLFPLSEDGSVTKYCVNFVCEIPKTTRKKFEVNTKAEGNAIKQDTKNGKLREYSKGDIWFNYGCLPRTWEDTEYVHPDVGCPGDGDPLDACEIGMRMFQTGEVRQTKVLGVICMIDEDETDWKLICIDVEDRWADELNDVDDVDRLLPGALDQIREWWRTYKVTDGKPLNKFGLDEKFMPRDYAMEVIVECHEAWKKECAKVSEEAKEASKEPKKMVKKALSFSKLEDLDLEGDHAALSIISGA